MNHMDSHFKVGLLCKDTCGALIHMSTMNGLAEAGG